MSPLPSTVLEVQIEAGQQVSDGDLLVTLDAGD
ncbi:MAG: biotin/lipoyl-binding protein [Candidatus Microthrix parvicella]